MTGSQLYGRWNFEMAQQGTETDEWEELSPEEKEAWNRLAEWVVGGRTV